MPFGLTQPGLRSILVYPPSQAKQIKELRYSAGAERANNRSPVAIQHDR